MESTTAPQPETMDADDEPATGVPAGEGTVIGQAVRVVALGIPQCSGSASGPANQDGPPGVPFGVPYVRYGSRTVLVLPMQLLYDECLGCTQPRFPDNYSLLLEGRLSRETYDAILRHLNEAVGRHYSTSRCCFWCVTVGSAFIALACFPCYHAYRMEKLDRALAEALASLNTRYRPQGVSLAAVRGVRGWVQLTAPCRH